MTNRTPFQRPLPLLALAGLLLAACGERAPAPDASESVSAEPPGTAWFGEVAPAIGRSEAPPSTASAIARMTYSPSPRLT